MSSRLLVIDGRPIALVTGIPYDGETAHEGLNGFHDFLQEELSANVELQEVDEDEVHLVLEGNVLQLPIFSNEELDEDWDENDQSDAPALAPEGWCEIAAD